MLLTMVFFVRKTKGLIKTRVVGGRVWVLSSRGWAGGWVEGWVGGWADGWAGGREGRQGGNIGS
jgi:hypothetical protein